MTTTATLPKPSASEIFGFETLIKGQPAKLQCVEVDGQVFNITRGPATVVSLEDEWFEDVKNPECVIAALQQADFKPDIFTFWQRIPDTQPKYSYHFEWESLAALPITTAEEWFAKKVSSRLRSQIRKAKKDGLEIRETAYDDDFVRGMTEIFNESPTRQGRPFWHYGKDFATVKKQFSRHVHREDMIGAYFKGELIGLIMLGNSGGLAFPGQIISKVAHRDKMTNNALIEKAVEICARKKIGWLVYFYWTNDSLAEFKRRCGFEETKVPRYFVPLTAKGKMMLKLGLHRGWVAAMPDRMKTPLKKLRKMWNTRKGE